MSKDPHADPDLEIWKVAAGINEFGLYDPASAQTPQPVSAVPIASPIFNPPAPPPPPSLPHTPVVPTLASTMALPGSRVQNNNQMYIIDSAGNPVPVSNSVGDSGPSPRSRRPQKSFLTPKPPGTSSIRAARLAEYHTETLDSVRFDPIMCVTTSGRYGSADTTKSAPLSTPSSSATLDSRRTSHTSRSEPRAPG